MSFEWGDLYTAQDHKHNYFNFFPAATAAHILTPPSLSAPPLYYSAMDLSSYADIQTPIEEDIEPVDSLPSSSAGSSTSESPSDDDEYSDAEREWRESLQQLELLLTMVLVPYLGKYFGRKCAYWSMYTLSLSRDAT